MNLDPATRETIETLLNANEVVLFMKGNPQQPQCGFSASIITELSRFVPDFVTIDVLQHPELREGIKVYANWPTIPQLYVKGELIGGNDIVQEMSSSGELAGVFGLETPKRTEPTITIDDSVAEAMRNAAQDQPTLGMHLDIDAAWQHKLSLAPASGNEIKVVINDIEILLDNWAAARAAGLHIVLEETLTGTSFRFDNPNAPPPVKEMAAQSLKEKLDAGDITNLYDVRPRKEDAVTISQAQLLDEKTAIEIENLPKDTTLVFHCHSGKSSRVVAERYRHKGFTDIYNVTGGILAWIKETDSAASQQ